MALGGICMDWRRHAKNVYLYCYRMLLEELPMATSTVPEPDANGECCRAIFPLGIRFGSTIERGVMTAPGGAWDTLDNGTYTIAVEANQAFDTAGNPVGATSLGSFLVSLSYTVYLPLVQR
jgi:hypothetical protein